MDSADLDFIKYLVRDLGVNVNGELNNIHYSSCIGTYIHKQTLSTNGGYVGHSVSPPTPPSKHRNYL